MINIKVWYSDTFLNPILNQFSDLIYALNTSHNHYKENTITKYHEILGISHLNNKSAKKLLEKLE